MEAHPIKTVGFRSTCSSIFWNQKLRDSLVGLSWRPLLEHPNATSKDQAAVRRL